MEKRQSNLYYYVQRSKLVFCTFLLLSVALSIACSTTRASSHELQVTIQQLAQILLSYPRKSKFVERRYRLIQPGVNVGIIFEVFYSSPSMIDPRVNRCVADPQKSKITCDLAFIDVLAEELGLTYEGYLNISSYRYNKNVKIRLLKWVIAHEIGHIALKHEPSDYTDPISGYLVYVPSQQKLELDADAYAINLIGNLEKSVAADYTILLDIVNMLIRRNLCPETFPRTCDKIAPGVGIVFNSANSDLIRISAGGQHPEFIARFLRLIFLAGTGTTINSINYLAGVVLSRMVVEVPGKGWISLDGAFRGASSVE